MPNDLLEFKNRQIWLSGSYSSKPIFLKNARVVEGMSFLTETTIEFLSSNERVDLQDILGSTMKVSMETASEEDRVFTGSCISAEYIGLYQGMSHFVAEVRPWLWFLTRTEENRIFQDLSVVEIIQQILGDHGFGSDLKNKLTGTYAAREYCVQYNETDYDFICRLMEEEGIYFFFTYESNTEALVLADSISAHKPTPSGPEFEFHFKEEEFRRRKDHIFDWAESTGVTSGKVTLNDYDFTKPKADQKSVKAIEKGKHTHKSHEIYKYPGHYRSTSLGDVYARIKMEAEAVKHKTSHGVCNIRDMAVGQTFTLKGHPRKSNNAEYLVIRAVHDLQIETDYEDDESKNPLVKGRIPVDETNRDTYRCTFDVIPKAEPYRAPLDTPWPTIYGLQTARVTGPEGEEIHTDAHGRIKVKFHWDRSGKNDDTTTCWVRVAMPWTGKGFGMISIPRIGNEVVIQFEEGDPDRPMCTGMLYNGDNKPAHDLPANKTQTGIVTRSTLKGSTDTFHELTFEDKKGAEYVRMQSERDSLEVVKNNKLVNIGGGHKSPGDLTQIVHRNKTEVVGEVRTHVVGILDDLTVGMVYDEAVGMVKTQTIGIYKEEKIGLTMPSLDNIVGDVLALGITLGGPISTLAYGGEYADFGAAATAINSLWSGREAGKKEEINGKSQLVVTGDRIETISKSKFPAAGKPGDMKTVVEDGKQEIEIKKGDRLIEVGEGKLKTDVKKGDLITNVDKGNHKTTVDTKNFTVDVKKGKVEIEAKMSIELKVGSNSIKIDNTGITLKGAMIKNEAQTVFKAEGKMTTVSGDMTMIDGNMVLIN
ncbi:MAG: type VI secretion system tip protein TssI/VgrG [Pseudomonadota bacterium]